MERMSEYFYYQTLNLHYWLQPIKCKDNYFVRKGTKYNTPKKNMMHINTIFYNYVNQFYKENIALLFHLLHAGTYFVILFIDSNI